MKEKPVDDDNIMQPVGLGNARILTDYAENFSPDSELIDPKRGSEGIFFCMERTSNFSTMIMQYRGLKFIWAPTNYFDTSCYGVYIYIWYIYIRISPVPNARKKVRLSFLKDFCLLMVLIGFV